MAGHSQFKNIMYRKGAQDKKRGKVFTKLIRELTTAARIGLPDPAANPRLRAAVLAARQANMPKDTVERAIKRGAGGEGGENYDEVRYEGYGPGGVAVIVEALTDNRNRTASEVRAAFTKMPAARSARPTASASCSTGSARSSIRPPPPAPTTCSKPRSRPAPSDVESDDERHVGAVAASTISTRCATRSSSVSARPESARLVWRPKTTLADRRGHRGQPVQAARNPRRQRRRAERLRQFRSRRRRPGAAERVMSGAVSTSDSPLREGAPQRDG